MNGQRRLDDPEWDENQTALDDYELELDEPDQ